MKKIWALLLTLTLVVGVVSPITTVYAEENDVLMMPYDETEKLNEETICAKVGEVEYTNYIQAWHAVQQNGGTIDVLSDWVLTGNLEVFSNKTITVNMNGHNIRRNL